MKRFFGEKYKDRIIIKDNEFNHMKKVLRMTEGDEVIASVNDENDYYCVIEKMDKTQAVLVINQTQLCPALPKKNIVLFQMLPKKEYLDNIIAKSVELGVSKIIPFTSEYTMMKDIRSDRVATQIMTACKQCGRSIPLKVENAITFKQMLERISDFDIVLFANEKDRLASQEIQDKTNIAIIIGSEGGFSDSEIEAINGVGAINFGLGERILRAETACLAMSAIVGYMVEV